MKLRFVALAGVLLTNPVVAFAASPIVTSPLPYVAFDPMQCSTTNVGTKALEIQITVRTSNGGNGSVSQTIDPGQAVYGSFGFPGNGFAWCEVTGVTKKTGRVTFCLSDGSRCSGPAVTAP